jgi:holo-[acyl-carrier protein] synthase
MPAPPVLCEDAARAVVGDVRTRVGIDIVDVSRIDESLREFGERFTKRLFTERELADAGITPSQRSQRLAARFAAKEATLKAFGLCESGIDWREMEVRRLDDGRCALHLHGKAATLAATSNDDIALSLSHDGGYAVAIVAAPPSRIS